MVGHITANDLKVKGITAIEELVTENDGVVITVRGIEKYVILPIQEYNNVITSYSIHYTKLYDNTFYLQVIGSYMSNHINPPI